MPYAQVSDIQFHYQEVKPGTSPATPLVFLHGFTLDHRMWRAQAEVFGKEYRVIVPDAKGHGLSDAPTTSYSRADRVEDLKGLVDALGLDRFHLVGLSMGGSTGIGFALEYQHRLASLSLVSTYAAGYYVGKKIDRIDRIAREEGLEAARAKWMEYSLLYYKDERAHLRPMVQQMMREHSGAIWTDPMRGRYPKEVDLDRVHTIGVPTLIVAGEEDTAFVKLARDLHERIPGSNLIVYEGIGHMINLEDPDRFNEDLGRFLATQRRREAS